MEYSRIFCIVLVWLMLSSNVSAQKGGKEPGKNNRNNDNKNGPITTTVFDFIVIGSGPAGAAVASRLSERSSRTVLLIEAGGDALDYVNNAFIKGSKLNSSQVVLTPINWDVTEKSQIDWSYLNYGEPHPMDNSKRFQAAGKALGGTTAINTMMYVRGNRDDYNFWVSQFGCTGWGWNDVLPFFKKVENSTRYATNPSFHGNSGPINLGPGGYQPKADWDIIIRANNETAQALGYPLRFTEDWNDGASTNVIGFHEHTINNRTGKRVTSMEYITPYINKASAQFRPNLFIASRSLAHKINFDTTSNPPRAISVTYSDNRNRVFITARANAEIIVSAGALRSPQLLKLSGVGPRSELQKFNIPVVANVPGVGENLHDHPVIATSWLSSLPNPPEKAYPSYNQSLGARCNTFLRSHYRPTTDGRNDIQIIWLPPTDSFMLGFAYNNHPLSRGSVTLATDDPNDRPQAIFNYFTDANDQDMKVMIDTVKYIYTYANTQTVQKFLWLEGPTDSNGQPSMADADIRRFLLANYGSGYHYAGSCKMGPTSDPMAVVDTQLRVRGVNGLRVCDASIMPQVTSGNTQAPTYMIGERCAAFVSAAHQ